LTVFGRHPFGLGSHLCSKSLELIERGIHAHEGELGLDHAQVQTPHVF
jgi:hypothetical protein